MEGEVPTIFDFDAALRQRLEPEFGSLGEVARHKLLFAVHRVAICRTGLPAFQGRCEAWKLGPVFLEIWNSPTRVGNPLALTGAAAELLRSRCPHSWGPIRQEFSGS